MSQINCGGPPFKPLPKREPLKAGDRVGSWDSTAGKAEITVKKRLGDYATPLDASKAVAASGKAGVTLFENGRVAAYSIDDGAYLDDLDIGDKPMAAKGLPVLEFLNDERETIQAGTTLLPPKGPDNGKIVRIFMSYNRLWDEILKTPKQLSTRDDVSRLRELGYTVMIDETATRDEFRSAVYDPRTAGVLWFGHGNETSVGTHSGPDLQASDIQPDWVSPNLKLMVFESCRIGKSSQAWAQALPGAEIKAWDRVLRNGESTWFNIRDSKGGLADLIETRLGGDIAKAVYKPPKPAGFGVMGAMLGGFPAAPAAAKPVAPQAAPGAGPPAGK